MSEQVDYVVPFTLTMRIKDISEIELEDYMFDIQTAISSVFYSDDTDDDHFDVIGCTPMWDKIHKEYSYES